MHKEVGSMPETLETFVFTLGAVIASPSLGRSELVVALVVAPAFLTSAVLSIFRQDDESAT
jgi:hypothetical protein